MIYPLLRPREICRLKIEDLNTRDWIIGVEAKTENRSYSRIIQKMRPTIEAMKIEGLPGGYSLFTPENKPGYGKLPVRIVELPIFPDSALERYWMRWVLERNTVFTAFAILLLVIYILVNKRKD